MKDQFLARPHRLHQRPNGMTNDRTLRKTSGPSIAVVMPTHGPLQPAAQALYALDKLSPRPDQVVIVVDTPPAPGEVAFLPRDARCVEVPRRSGPAVARNAGVDHVSTDWVLFVDSDVVVPADTIQRVQEIQSRHPGLAAVFGAYDSAPGDPGFLSQYRNLLHRFVHLQGRSEAETFWAGLGAVRVDLFRKLGGFDPRFRRPSIEDIELGCRIRDSGGTILLDKSLQATHLKRWTFVSMMRTDLLDRGIPWTRLILKRGRAPKDLSLDPTARLSTALTGLGLLGLGLGVWNRWAAALGFLSLLLLLGINSPFYRHLAELRGPSFALRAIPHHLLFYLTCGMAGILGAFLHVFGTKDLPRTATKANAQQNP